MTASFASASTCAAARPNAVLALSSFRESRRDLTRSGCSPFLARQTAGVECRKDAGVIDEIPGAYKDIDEVISNSDDLVEVVARLKQVMCVKG